jgi:hypothetical protein
MVRNLADALVLGLLERHKPLTDLPTLLASFQRILRKVPGIEI